MSDMTYDACDEPHDKLLAWLRGQVKTAPLGPDARIEAGFLLRRLQRGESLGWPQSRPMPDVGIGCHELRIVDDHSNWRIMYPIAKDAIVIPDAFRKKTAATPKHLIAQCQRRLMEFRRVVQSKTGGDRAHR